MYFPNNYFGSLFAIVEKRKFDFKIENVNDIAFIFLDTEPPTCGFCPTDKNVNNATKQKIRVNWARPQCSDNSGQPPGITSSRQSGDEFSVPGSYEVAYTVTDGYGNTNKNCSFRIQIKSEYLLQRLP